MAKRPTSFRQADVTRAIKGAVAAGLTPSRAEIDAQGKIVLDLGKPAESRSALEDWRAKRAAS